jgi:hypothetical protein
LFVLWLPKLPVAISKRDLKLYGRDLLLCHYLETKVFKGENSLTFDYSKCLLHSKHLTGNGSSDE